MGELASALDGLAAEDVHALFGPALLDRLAELLAAQHRLAAEVTRTVREAELTSAPEHDGLKTMTSWLRGRARLSGAAAARLVRCGRALEHLPAVKAAAAAGTLSAEQVAELAKLAAPDALARAAAQGIDLPAVEAALVDLAADAPHADLVDAVRHYLAALDPDGPEPDPTAGRSLTLARHPDGSWTVRGALDDLGGEKLATALEAVAAAGRGAGDERTRAQRAGDALVQLADTALAAGQLPVLRTVKPTVVVGVDLDDLLGQDTGPGAATTGSGGTTSAARARQAACDSVVVRIVFGPEGRPVDLGREHRVVPAHLRRLLEARDGGCVFAGCAAPAWWCEAHHLVHWADDGKTEPDNLALLCERHHGKVHAGFRITPDTRPPDQPPGDPPSRVHGLPRTAHPRRSRWRTWRPDGTEILPLAPLRT